MISLAVKRACDACHRRKVRCDGVIPCRNCGSSQLCCTYNTIPQKKGPKGSRAKVISELRESQRLTSLAAKMQSKMHEIQSPPIAPSSLPTPGLVTVELVRECVDFFFRHLHPRLPILGRRHVERQLDYMDHSRDAYCLMASLCAFVMLQPGKSAYGPSVPAQAIDPFGLDLCPLANITSSELLAKEAVRVRGGSEHFHPSTDGCVTLNTLTTDYFLFAAASAVEAHDQAWYHLRDASTLMLISAMHRDETYAKWDFIEASVRRRLYWAVLIAERAYGFQRQRPLSLQASIKPPCMTHDPSDPPAYHINNFSLQVAIFALFDDALVSAWCTVKSSLSGLQAPDMASLQKEANNAASALLNLDTRQTDLDVNRQWLKSTIWRLRQERDSLVPFHPYSTNPERELLVSLASHFPAPVVGLISPGVIETVFNACLLVIDYLAVQPSSRHPFTVGPREQLGQILNIVAVLRNECNQYLPLLLSKLHDMIPCLANPMLQDAPDEAPVPVCKMQLFDQLGMAEPEQMCIPIQINRARYAQSPSSTPSGSSGPLSDVGAHFVVSPPSVRTPGLEYVDPYGDYGRQRPSPPALMTGAASVARPGLGRRYLYQDTQLGLNNVDAPIVASPALLPLGGIGPTLASSSNGSLIPGLFQQR